MDTIDSPQSRTELLLGTTFTERLAQSAVAVFGLGGVGSYAVEALARAGVGHLALVDGDTVALSNLNRQLFALYSTLDRPKTEAARDRVLDINPQVVVDTYTLYYGPDTVDAIDLSRYDYLIDAVDCVTAKLLLAERSRLAGVPLISSMGAGNKLDPTRFVIADIYSTSVCPLARVMRRELRARGIPSLKVVYSTEPPVKPARLPQAHDSTERPPPGSVSFVPSVAGLILAGEVIKDLNAVCSQNHHLST